jgi:hypothetical protein
MKIRGLLYIILQNRIGGKYIYIYGYYFTLFKKARKINL